MLLCQRGRGVNRRGACGRGKSRGRGGQTQRDYVRQLGEEAEKQGSNSDFYVFALMMQTNATC